MNLAHIYLQIKHIVLTLGPLIYDLGGTGGSNRSSSRIHRDPSRRAQRAFFARGRERPRPHYM